MTAAPKAPKAQATPRAVKAQQESADDILNRLISADGLKKKKRL